MSDKNNPLELYLVEKFKEIDPKAHRTSGSGAGDLSKGDISNKFCAVEAKIKRSHENIIVDYKYEWLKTHDQKARGTSKFVIIATQNCYGENFITMGADDFFTLMKEAKHDR